MGADGCVGIRLPERTTVWARAAKKSVHARRSSSAVKGRISGGMGGSAYRRGTRSGHP